MKQWLRSFVFLPAAILALVIIPSIAFSKADSSADMQSALFQTIPPESPLPPGGTIPPGGTVPPPPVKKPRKHRHYPTATPYYQPTATPIPYGAVIVDGSRLQRVIGDRLSSTIYGYTANGRLYRSNNDGRTWYLVATDPVVDDFIMSAADPNVLYSGAGIPCDGGSYPSEPMYKSVDGGVNWSLVPGADNLRPLLAHQGDTASIFAADCDQPYVSQDGGATWTAKPDTSANALWDTFIAVDMAAASLLGDPRPDTANWDQIVVGGIAEDGSGVVAFTNDLGDTWTQLTPNVYPASWGMSAVAVDVYTDGLVAFAEPKSVWQTENYGVNWQISTMGLEALADSDLAGDTLGLLDLVYHPNGTLYLGTVEGLYTKGLSGQSWSKVTGSGFVDSAVNGLLYTESGLGTLWLNTADGVYTHQVTP
jgi:hypothetical protein